MNTKLCTLRPWAVDDICVTILNMDEIFCIFFIIDEKRMRKVIEENRKYYPQH